MKIGKHSSIILFLRSLAFFIYSLTLIFLCSFACLLSIPFKLPTRHKVIRFFLRSYVNGLRFLCGVNYQVLGRENIPTDRIGIVFSKHQSTWETMYLPLIFLDPAVIVKRELMWIPFFGWGLATSQPISINRSDKSTAMQQIINKGKYCLEQNRWILIFPEGTRVPAGKVGKYHLGGARLAVATESFVIPVAHNAGYFWPKRKFIKYPGTVQVVIGPVIETKGRTPEEVMFLAKTWIESTLLNIENSMQKPTR